MCRRPEELLAVQAAYDAAKASAQAEVIGLFANTTENLLLDGSKSLTITQCTVARVTGAGSDHPVWNITSTGKLTIIGPDSVGGSIGWRVAGNGGHNLKSIRANGASQYGVLITSNSNSVSWNDVSGNGNGTATRGIRVEGGTNTLKGGTVGPNNGDGVQLIGSSNNLSGSTITEQHRQRGPGDRLQQHGQEQQPHQPERAERDPGHRLDQHAVEQRLRVGQGEHA